MFLLRVTNYKEQAPLDQQPTAVSEEQGNVSQSSENNGRAEGGEWRAPGEGECRGPQGRLGYHRMDEKQKRKIQQFYRKTFQEELDQGGLSLADLEEWW